MLKKIPTNTNKQSLLHRLLPIVLCIAIVSLFAKQVYSGTITDNFDDNTINPRLWTAISEGGPSVNEVNNRLEITIPSYSSGYTFYAGYQTVLTFSGDIDVTVDYILLTWPMPSNGVRMGIVSIGGAVERVGWEYFGEHYVADFLGYLFYVPTMDTSGKLRLTRIGNQISGYYWAGNNWIILGSLTSDQVAGPTTIGLMAWSHDCCFSDQDVVVAFDNFSISGPNVVPIPGTLLLLGSGMVGVGVIRKRFMRR